VPSPDGTVAVFLLVTGRVQLAAASLAGQVRTLELLEPGGFFTLGGALATGPAGWVAQALVPATVVYEFPVPVVEAVLAGAPAVALAVVRLQHARLAAAYARLVEVGGVHRSGCGWHMPWGSWPGRMENTSTSAMRS
jgi:CRP-like cAMP-binding protein